MRDIIMSRVVIYKPNTANNQEDKYKVSAWKKRGGVYIGSKFTETKKQALEIQRRFRKQLK